MYVIYQGKVVHSLVGSTVYIRLSSKYVAVLCEFSPDYIFFQLLLEHIFSLQVCLFVVVVVSRRAPTHGYVK